MRRLIVLMALPLLAFTNDAPPPPQQEPSARRFRLDLHVPPQGGIYFSAWGEAEVIASHDGSDSATVTYRRRYYWFDGCQWEATETLVPTRARRYRYSYREAPLSCPTGAVPHVDATTPRDGFVTVHPTASTKQLTPLVAWTRGWETPR
jgi:hypothetical protein